MKWEVISHNSQEKTWITLIRGHSGTVNYKSCIGNIVLIGILCLAGMVVLFPNSTDTVATW